MENLNFHRVAGVLNFNDTSPLITVCHAVGTWV